MESLYDLLGALPDDGADELRAAFRSAVKRAHPDVNPGDPDAELKFRRILRANEILGDDEQREAYDSLLALAHREQKRAVADKVKKLASGVAAIAAGSVVAVGGYALLLQLSANALAPTITTPEAANQPAAFVAAGPAGTGASSAPAAPQEASRHADVTTMAIVPATESAPIVVTPPVRFRSSLGHRPKQAPKLTSAFTDRDIMSYRWRKFARAFAQIAPANAYPTNIYKERTARPRHGDER